MRALAAACIFSLFVLLPAAAQAQSGPPLPDPNFLTKVTESPCTYDVDDEIEKQNYEQEGWGAETDYTRYPGNCTRMKFAYGPIPIKPGANDVLVGPVTIEKPMQDGYITRFKPNLVDQTGAVPPVENVHLHHGTWLALTNNYGNSAFFAAGEEKTIAPWPKGFGMPIKATDQWQLLYMVHSAVQQPMLTWITYEIDFVTKAQGDAMGMKPALPIWLDVRPSAYPVFNTMRKYGGPDGMCTWPREECADFDPYGKKIPGNGLPANSPGTDFTLPAAGEDFGSTPFHGGTLIGLGGHLHPGGIQNEVDIVRGDKVQRIYNGVPSYWNRDDKTKPGGPPTSWDFSMRVSGLPKWGVHVEPGDKLRSNATYDTTIASSYENMGIAVGLLVPDNPDGSPNAPGMDPFTVPVDESERCDSGGLEAPDGPQLCVNGFLETHGHYAENGNYSGPSGETELGGAEGQETTEVAIADFFYLPGDLTLRDSVGIPKVKLGSSLRFTNADTALGIPHTITTCAYPCLGATGAAFPLPDGSTSAGRPIELDSSQLGYGAPEISGYKNEAVWETPVTAEEGYEPNEIVTYFCRIHPSMRGAFKVVE